LMYLFMSSAFFSSINISYLLSRKYKWGSECVSPIFRFLHIMI
jgi:hypothetical protein